MVFEPSHRFVGRSAEYTRTVVACLSAFWLRTVQILHRTESVCKTSLRSGWLKVTDVVQQNQCNAHIVNWQKMRRGLRHSPVGESLEWMCGRKYRGDSDSTATEVEVGINETEEG